VRRVLRMLRPGPPRRPNPRTVSGWLGLALVLGLLGGRTGLVLAGVIMLWDLLYAPAPRLLLRAALLGFLAVPVAILVRGLPTGATLSPDFAAGSLLPHLLAGTSLALLVLGTLRDVRTRLPSPGDRPELAAPSVSTDLALMPPGPDGRTAEGEESP
jgi:hypothetical protein